MKLDLNAIVFFLALIGVIVFELIITKKEGFIGCGCGRNLQNCVTFEEPEPPKRNWGPVMPLYYTSSCSEPVLRPLPQPNQCDPQPFRIQPWAQRQPVRGPTLEPAVNMSIPQRSVASWAPFASW